jgi:hypothetical protein
MPLLLLDLELLALDLQPQPPENRHLEIRDPND